MQQAIIKDNQNILDLASFRNFVQNYLKENGELAFYKVFPVLELAGFTQKSFSTLLLVDPGTAYKVFQLAYLCMRQKEATWKLEIIDSREDYV